ncbi:hypothetical protein FHG87_016637 [Trinorchestia longiramus]|nr:hypothetical protein FHG87_016637 [Trinorchestia longiramus]
MKKQWVPTHTGISTLPHSHCHTHTLPHPHCRTHTLPYPHAATLSHPHAATPTRCHTHTPTLPHPHCHTHYTADHKRVIAAAAAASTPAATRAAITALAMFTMSIVISLVDYDQLGRLVSESACERKDPGSNPAADMVDAARNTAWDLGK